MFPTADYAATGRALLESQIAAFASMTRIMTQDADKTRTLGMAAAKAWGEHWTAAATKWAAVKNPQAFWALSSQSAKANTESITAYNGQLTDLRCSTTAQLANIVIEQVAAAQDKVSAHVDDFARNSPAGTEILVALMKASVANSQSIICKPTSLPAQPKQAPPKSQKALA